MCNVSPRSAVGPELFNLLGQVLAHLESLTEPDAISFQYLKKNPLYVIQYRHSLPCLLGLLGLLGLFGLLGLRHSRSHSRHLRKSNDVALPTLAAWETHKEDLVRSAGEYCSNRKQANYCQLNGRFIAYAYWISRGWETVEAVHHSLRRCREDRKGGGGHGSRLSKTFASSSERGIERGAEIS